MCEFDWNDLETSVRESLNLNFTESNAVIEIIKEHIIDSTTLTKEDIYKKVQILVIYYEEENESIINQILNKSQIGYEINNNWGEITMPFCGPREYADELIGQLETLKSKIDLERKKEIDRLLYTRPDLLDKYKEELESLE